MDKQQVRLEIRPISIRAANDFVRAWHRHSIPTAGGKFAVGVYLEDELHGVALCGRPVARYLDDELTLEVYRCCTDGTRNACSMLYGAAVRVARAMGYRRVITYTLESEPGSSLKAANFHSSGPAGGKTGKWTGARAREYQTSPAEGKIRWQIDL